MTLFDSGVAETTNMQEATTIYAAGEEPWNKNINGFNIEEIPTENQEYIVDWEKWHGIYRTIPEFKTSTLTNVAWIIGRKIGMDEKTEKITKKFKGQGKDTFRQLLFNHKLTSKICGDAYMEKVRDKAGRLINIIPKDPGTIRIVANPKGRIIKYEQVFIKSKSPKDIKVIADWDVDDIFHTSNNRIADEIHGIPDSESMQVLIKSRKQIEQTYAVTLHRYMKPTFFYETNTDDPTEIERIKTIIDNTIKNFENAVLPKGTLEAIKETKVAQFSILDPIPWMTFLSKNFTRNSRVPDIVQGESRESAISSGELNYISFKEKIIQEQLEYAEDIEKQLGLIVSFTEPREISIEAQQNKSKEDKGKQRND